jgi:hypothetical protein
MPQKLLWTEPRDAQLRRLRGDGASWDMIAAALAISRNAAIERGRRLGARLPPPARVAEVEDRYLRDPRRDPLPIGHPMPWGLLTAGTSIAGEPFPDGRRPEASRTQQARNIT